MSGWKDGDRREASGPTPDWPIPAPSPLSFRSAREAIRIPGASHSAKCGRMAGTVGDLDQQVYCGGAPRGYPGVQFCGVAVRRTSMLPQPSILTLWLRSAHWPGHRGSKRLPALLARRVRQQLNPATTRLNSPLRAVYAAARRSHADRQAIDEPSKYFSS